MAAKNNAAAEFRAPAMDGSIADLYGVEGWLEALQNETVSPYADAQPLCDMAALRQVLEKLNYIIGIISWSSKTGSPAFHRAIRKAKIAWLQKHNLLLISTSNGMALLKVLSRNAIQSFRPRQSQLTMRLEIAWSGGNTKEPQSTQQKPT